MAFWKIEVSIKARPSWYIVFSLIFKQLRCPSCAMQSITDTLVRVVTYAFWRGANFMPRPKILMGLTGGFNILTDFAQLLLVPCPSIHVSKPRYALICHVHTSFTVAWVECPSSDLIVISGRRVKIRVLCFHGHMSALCGHVSVWMTTRWSTCSELKVYRSTTTIRN